MSLYGPAYISSTGIIIATLFKLKFQILNIKISIFQKSTTLMRPLELAIEVGYRHIAIETRSDRDLRTGGLFKNLLESGKVSREDIFISLKVSVLLQYVIICSCVLV